MQVLASAPPLPRPLEGLRVLVAEDTATFRVLYGSVLRAAGAEVETAADGLAAFRTWEAASLGGRPFRLAVVDFGMPYLNGAALTAMLRAAGFSGPVVGMTAGVGRPEESLWRGCGCDAVLRKGLPVGEIVAALAAACGRSSAPPPVR